MIKLKSLFLTSCFIFAVGLVSQPVYSQCGVYFKPGYHAVGKVNPIGSNAWALSDWNGDGRLDFWNYRPNASTGFRDVIIYPALPTGFWNWDAPIVYTANASIPVSPAGSWVDDFDGDGRVDVMSRTSQFGSRTIQIHRNVGDGTLQTLTPTPEGETLSTFVRDIGFLDINSDGRLDWVYTLEDTATGTETLTYSHQNVDGSFGPRTTVFVHTGDNELNDSQRLIGDFDNDGKDDIAYKNFSSPGRIRIVKNNGNSTFTLGSPIQLVDTRLLYFPVIDFNLDGRADILTYGDGTFVVYYGQSNGTLSPGTTFTVNGFPSLPALKVADLNGDGRPDIMNFGSGTSGSPSVNYEIFLNNPAGEFERTFYPRRIVQYPFPVVISDFTGDGKADMYDVSHQTNMFGDEVLTISTNVCAPVGQTKALDFDGVPPYDTYTTWNGSTGEWRTGSTTFRWGTASLGDVPAPGDFDGDLKTDYTVYRNGEGNWYVFLSSTSSWFVFRFGLPGDIPIPNDYDGGGKSDFAVFRPSDGNWYIWYSETQSFSAMHWGSNGDHPVPADYDGDGKTDIAVFRQSAGDWYYVKSSDQGYGIVHWGTDGDVPVPADYDGDGRADLAVFRSGMWHIQRSLNGAYSLISWGTAGDVPVPFLERGDTANPVVFRPSNGRWYNVRRPFEVVIYPAGVPVKFGLPNN